MTIDWEKNELGNVLKAIFLMTSSSESLTLKVPHALDLYAMGTAYIRLMG